MFIYVNALHHPLQRGRLQRLALIAELNTQQKMASEKGT
jgi:hypothetical protein